MMRQYRLKVDFDKCEDCGSCEKALPKFRSVYGGILPISGTRYQEEDTQKSVDAVIAACPRGAVKLHVV